MATITGLLTDFGLKTLGDFPTRLFFTPSNAAVKGSRLLTDKPVEATVYSAGGFTVDLESTDGMIPDGTFYTVTVWQGIYHYDVFGLRVFLPEGTWSLAELPSMPLSTNLVLVSLDPPPAGYRGWYLNAGLGDPDDIDLSGTGILEIVS